MGVSQRFAYRVTGGEPNDATATARADDPGRPGRRTAEVATRVGQQPPPARFPQRRP
jgi:hypothetical protein